MSGAGVLIFAAATAVAGAVSAVRTMAERRRTRRDLFSKPALDPAGSEGTEVRVTGTVRATAPTLTAPLSGRRCVAYRSRLQIRAGALGAAARPKEASSVAPFTLERSDGTSIAITSEHARIVDLPAVKLGPDTAARREQFALTYAVASGDRRRARYEEIVIEDGMHVSIAGLLMKDPAEPPTADDERGFRDAPPMKLRLAGNADHPIIIGPPR